MKLSIRRFAVVAVATLALAACSADSVTSAAPAAAPAHQSAALLDGLLNGLVGMEGVQRTTPLTAPITVEAIIGRAGGTLSIPSAGVTVTVPYGALDTDTQITMTARAGKLVAYDFEPHGIVFAKPLVFKQNLRGTTASLLQVPLLKLAYYQDPSLLSETTGLVSQLLGGAVNLLSWTFTSTIPHFSGYMIGCGREE